MRSPYGGFVASSPVAASLSRDELIELAPLEVHEAAQLRALGILDRRANRRRVVVVAAQDDASRRSRLATCARFIDQALPQLAIVAAPADEAEIAAQRPGRDIERHHRGFDHERARAAHRIDELAAVSAIAGQPLRKQHRSREIFLQRRSDAARAICATMQALAGKIEAQRRAIAIQSHVQSHVRPLELDRRPLPGALAQLIDDRVLGFQRAEMRVR